VILIELLVLPA